MYIYMYSRRSSLATLVGLFIISRLWSCPRSLEKLSKVWPAAAAATSDPFVHDSPAMQEQELSRIVSSFSYTRLGYGNLTPLD